MMNFFNSFDVLYRANESQHEQALLKESIYARKGKVGKNKEESASIDHSTSTSQNTNTDHSSSYFSFSAKTISTWENKKLESDDPVEVQKELDRLSRMFCQKNQKQILEEEFLKAYMRKRQEMLLLNL